MMRARWKTIAAASVLVAGTAVGMAAFARGQKESAGPGRAQEVASSHAPQPWRTSLEARVETAREILKLNMERLRYNVNIPGGATEIFDKIPTWSRRLMEDRLRLASTPTERVDAVREHRNRMILHERLVSAYNSVGQGRGTEALEGKYYRLEADQLLAEAGVDPEKEPPVVDPQQDPAAPPPSPAPTAPR
jgi:hypothetical protein